MARLAIFFLVVGLSLGLLHWLVNAGLKRVNTSTFGVANRIVQGQVNADIVISGSSRAMVHYDPRVIQAITGKSAFNIGLNGSQTDMQLAWLKTYFRHNQTPRVILHNLDLFSFQTTHGGVYDPAQYLPYLSEPDVYASLRRINPEIWKARYLPLYGYAVEDMRFTWVTGLKGLLGIHPREDRVLGFVPRPWSWTGEFDEFQRANTNGVTFQMEPEGEQAMEKLIQLCQQRGTVVILAYSPEYKPMQELETNRGEIFDRFKQLAQRYQVKLWDFSDSPICLDRRFFYNSQHLNAAGAEQFSQALAARLVAERIVSPAEGGLVGHGTEMKGR